MLFHDEITGNFDVASCTQKIASRDTIRSSSGPITSLNENGDLSFLFSFSKKCLIENIQGKF